jgi:hypothetical protein
MAAQAVWMQNGTTVDGVDWDGVRNFKFMAGLDRGVEGGNVWT